MAPRDETSGRTVAPVNAFRKLAPASASGSSTCIVFHTSKPVGGQCVADGISSCRNRGTTTTAVREPCWRANATR